jgi:hypothetical protein
MAPPLAAPAQSQSQAAAAPVSVDPVPAVSVQAAPVRTIWRYQWMH